MSNLLISEIDTSLFARLRDAAISHGRTPAAEAVAVLQKAFASSADTSSRTELMRQAAAFRAQARPGPSVVDLIREGREDR